jgi:hypothetical protein
VYSPMLSIEGSSQPFQAFLGAILSVIKGVSVEASPNSSVKLDEIEEKGGDKGKDSGPYAEDDIDNGLGVLRPAIKHTCDEGNESGLMVCPFLHCYLSCCPHPLRLFYLPRNHLHPSKCGYISIPFRTTPLPFHSVAGLEAGNHTCG